MFGLSEEDFAFRIGMIHARWTREQELERRVERSPEVGLPLYSSRGDFHIEERDSG